MNLVFYEARAWEKGLRIVVCPKDRLDVATVITLTNGQDEEDVCQSVRNAVATLTEGLKGEAK